MTIPNADIAARLREARSAFYDSAADAARAMQVSAATYRAHENGTRGIPMKALERYARRFKKSFAWLATGREGPVQMLPLSGHVGAGAVVYLPESRDSPGLGFAPWPPGASPDQVGEAFIVRGDSCYPVYEDGHILITGAPRPPEECIGRFCVVETASRQLLVKRVHRGAPWTLASPNAPPLEDVMICTCAPVRWVILPA